MGPAQRIAISWMLLVMMATAAADEPDFAEQRRQMVSDVAAMARSTASEIGRDRFSEPVLRALGNVPRHRFVPAASVDAAYRNSPLPIGQGQTISQPYIVALSTELIEAQARHVVLEVGTGSGYQAAVLAEIVERVYSIEVVESLGLPQRRGAHRRRIPGLAAEGPVRRDRGDRRRAGGARSPPAAAQAGRAHGHSCRQAPGRPGSAAHREVGRRLDPEAGSHPGPLRAVDGAWGRRCAGRRFRDERRPEAARKVRK